MHTRLDQFKAAVPLANSLLLVADDIDAAEFFQLADFLVTHVACPTRNSEPEAADGRLQRTHDK